MYLRTLTSMNELLYSMITQWLIKQHLLRTRSHLPWSGSWSCNSSSLYFSLQCLPVQVSVCL